jgi:hypothetical protein
MDTLMLKCDANELLALIERLKHALELSDVSLDVGELPAELVSVETDDSAALTGELTMRLKPSDDFVRFAAAILAGDRDGTVVEYTSHGASRGARAA